MGPPTLKSFAFRFFWRSSLGRERVSKPSPVLPFFWRYLYPRPDGPLLPQDSDRRQRRTATDDKCLFCFTSLPGQCLDGLRVSQDSDRRPIPFLLTSLPDQCLRGPAIPCLFLCGHRAISRLSR